MNREPNNLNSYTILAGFWVSLAAACGAQELSSTQLPQNPTANLPIKQVATGVFELGLVRFDKKQKTVSFPAEVNMREGLIEYLMVGSAGKLHESLLRTEAEPGHIHVAMLLVGAKGSPQKPSAPADAAVTNQPPWIDSASLKNSSPLKGDAVSIWLSWKTAGGEKRCRAEEWVFNQQTQAPRAQGNWIYTGSMVINGTFMAQRERSIAALVMDPFALINNPGRGHDNDEIWQVNSSVAPPDGTAVQITIKLE